jgi:hypothetical protein
LVDYVYNGARVYCLHSHRHLKLVMGLPGAAISRNDYGRDTGNPKVRPNDVEHQQQSSRSFIAESFASLCHAHQTIVSTIGSTFGSKDLIVVAQVYASLLRGYTQGMTALFCRKKAPIE